MGSANAGDPRGADPDRTEIVEIEEVPLAYLTTPAVRVRAKAAGPLAAF